MARMKLNGAMHPSRLFYDTRSIRQEIERMFGGWPEYATEPYWRVRGGFVHPFKDYKRVFATEADLKEWSDELDRKAESLFSSAEVVVITLGLIEAWKQPRTGNFYTEIPHPDNFESLGAKLYRLSVSEMFDDLQRIREVLREHTQAEIIITVSPIPLHATMTPLDIRVANIESKSRIRAAVSEFIDRFPDVHYFHSYEIVTTAERLGDFMLEDGRHVHRKAVDYVICEFLKMFAREELTIPEVDISWLTSPTKVAERPTPHERSLAKKYQSALSRLTRRS